MQAIKELKRNIGEASSTVASQNNHVMQLSHVMHLRTRSLLQGHCRVANTNDTAFKNERKLLLLCIIFHKNPENIFS